MIITIFGEEGGIRPPTTNAFRALWKKVTGFGDERIVGCGAGDGASGRWAETETCRPCTEVHWFNNDLTDGAARHARHLRPGPTPAGHGWMEIWNLVFMQFDQAIDRGRRGRF